MDEVKRVPPRAFVKGDPRCGRPKGCKNKRTILRAAILLALKGISPAEELAKIAKKTRNESTRVDIWKYLHSFIEAPQDKPIPYRPDTPEESKANVDASIARLQQLARPLAQDTPKPV